jgi:hypothetical protein
MANNMAFTFLRGAAGDGLMLLVHTTRAPSDAEWKPYFEELAQHDPIKLKSLVFTDGGAPSGAQRKQVNDMLNGRTSMAAVVTPSTVVRGVVTALSWFNPKIKVFPPDQTEAALTYLGVKSDELPQVRLEIQILRQKLGQEGLRSIVSAA